MPDAENDEILEELNKIERKLDKILSLNTKIAKVLHLIPITEKEEKAFQIQRANNLNISKKVYDELEQFKKPVESIDNTDPFYFSNKDLFSDIVGNDFLGDE